MTRDRAGDTAPDSSDADTAEEQEPYFEGFVETLESNGAQRLPTRQGTALLVPSEFFAEEELPDVDAGIAKIERPEGHPLAAPMVGLGLGGGLHLLAPEHLAALWARTSAGTLRREYHLRKAHGEAIPPVVEDAIDSTGEEAQHG